MAVCARCFALGASLVLGGFLAARLPRRFRVSFPAMCVAAIPMALDGFTQLFGFRESTNTLRVLTGGLSGAAVAFWIVPTLYDAFDEIRKTGRQNG